MGSLKKLLFNNGQDDFVDLVYDLNLPKIEKVNNSFTEADKELYCALRKLVAKEKDRSIYAIHPSEVVQYGLCKRQAFLILARQPYNRKKVVIDQKLQRIFDLGTLIHLYIQVNLYKSGYLTSFAEPEIKNKNVLIEGHADGEIVWNGEKMILEIKSINTFSFAKLSGALDKHIKQASLYADAKKLKKIFFVYYDKNSSDIKYFIENVDFEFVKNYKRQINAVKMSFAKQKNLPIEKMKLPKRQCRSESSVRAENCIFSEICFKLQNK